MKEIVGGEEMFVNERASKPVLPTWGQTLGSQTLMARQRDALSELELDLEPATGPHDRALVGAEPLLYHSLLKRRREIGEENVDNVEGSEGERVMFLLYFVIIDRRFL